MYIQLNALRFHARHGVLPQERTVGGDFRVDLSLQIADRQAHGALCHDQLEATVNYADVYEKVRQEMDCPSALIEHVAGRIARSLLRSFPALRQVEVRVAKVSPPIPGFVGESAAVEYSLRRSLVVWDFDGTLADTSAGIVRTMQATFARHGWAVPQEADIRQTIGLPLQASMLQLGVAEGEAVRQAVATYQQLFEELGVVRVGLFPGIAEVLQRQHEAGRLIAIATSRGHRSVVALCEQLGIRPYFDYIVACEDVQAHKPDPAPVFRLQHMAGVDAADVTVIGDTSFDMQMGRNAHVGRCIGVVWGNHSAAQLCEGGADFVACSPTEL